MTFLQVLRSAGFKRMSWDKCPRGFQDRNYQCFSHQERNLWAEVYLTDKPVYMQLEGVGIGYNGKFFYEPKELNDYLNKQP
jgi:hypothetical protein